MEDKKEKLPSTNINWFPGHIAKARKKIIEDLKLIDVVIEILDARIPMSSKNNDLESYFKDKKRIIVLNKIDLSDEGITKQWIEFYNNKGIKCIGVEANSGKGIKQVVDIIKDLYKEQKEEFANKGRVGRHCRVMVMGIPNVGKSTFINKIANKNIAIVANKPGVTKQNQWIKLDKDIDLMDTPGMVWPKLDDDGVGMHLAFVNSIGTNAYDEEEVAYYLLEFLIKNYKEQIISRYGITTEGLDTLKIRDEIAKKRGCILSGGVIDENKVSQLLLNDFRNGKIGRITIEKVD